MEAGEHAQSKAVRAQRRLIGRVPRSYCQQPAACVAGARGACSLCQQGSLARTSERMKRLHADPEFKARTSERMKRLHADPEFKARNAASASERMKRLNADPEFRTLIGHDLPSLTKEQRRIYLKLRSNKIERTVALAEALREVA